MNEIDQHDHEKWLGDEPFLWFGGSIFRTYVSFRQGKINRSLRSLFSSILLLSLLAPTNVELEHPNIYRNESEGLQTSAIQAGIIKQHFRKLGYTRYLYNVCIAIPGVCIYIYIQAQCGFYQVSTS